LRRLVSNVAQAMQILMAGNMPARMDEVVAVEIEDQPGGLARILKPLLEGGISINYAYGLVGAPSGKAVMIFRFNDNNRAISLLQGQGIRLLDPTSSDYLLERA
ncbi:MAG TPA: amino acid-binding protein, partial [Thermodesulfobacteriota bacterium]|nr:amino acid-binding protein [Thermodesulfobacteriota bacterium]